MAGYRFVNQGTHQDFVGHIVFDDNEEEELRCPLTLCLAHAKTSSLRSRSGSCVTTKALMSIPNPAIDVQLQLHHDGISTVAEVLLHTKTWLDRKICRDRNCCVASCNIQNTDHIIRHVQNDCNCELLDVP